MYLATNLLWVVYFSLCGILGSIDCYRIMWQGNFARNFFTANLNRPGFETNVERLFAPVALAKNPRCGKDCEYQTTDYVTCAMIVFQILSFGMQIVFHFCKIANLEKMAIIHHSLVLILFYYGASAEAREFSFGCIFEFLFSSIFMVK